MAWRPFRSTPRSVCELDGLRSQVIPWKLQPVGRALERVGDIVDGVVTREAREGERERAGDGEHALVGCRAGALGKGLEHLGCRGDGDVAGAQGLTDGIVCARRARDLGVLRRRRVVGNECDALLDRKVRELGSAGGEKRVQLDQSVGGDGRGPVDARTVAGLGGEGVAELPAQVGEAVVGYADRLGRVRYAQEVARLGRGAL